MWKSCFGLSLWLLICQAYPALADEQFTERLNIRPLPDGRLYTHFSFKILLKGAVPRHANAADVEDEPQHYRVFPLALGQIIREYSVTEMHLSLNAGKWDYDTWSYPEDPSVGSGAELWAWMEDPGHGSFDERLQGLRNALAGVFCASLGELDERRTTRPVRSFRPQGDFPTDTIHRLAYSSHPSERICTENLTPFLKLLPCKSRSGIASLLNPHRIFDADWHGMSVHVLWRRNAGVEVQLGVQAVFNPVRLKEHSKRDWMFSNVFERTIDAPCPAADESVISVKTPQSVAYSITPEPTRFEHGSAQYDVSRVETSLNVALNYVQEMNFVYPLEPAILAPLSVTRTHTGTSQALGSLQITFKNTLNTTQRVAYLETPPWFIKLYLSTLTLTVGSDPLPRPDILQELKYLPTTAHRPTHFEPTLILPPRSSVQLALTFDKAFLRYTDHPPDAQRGWDLPPAVLVPLPAHSYIPRVYTPTLLVDLATPDFSMPYNVIIMSSTLIALLFGSIFNLLTRRFVVVKVD